MHHARRFTLLGLSLTTLALAATLKSVSSFSLPGPVGKRFDYLTIDYDDHYLLSAHLAAGLLYVIDLRSNRVVKAIPDVPGVEGVEFVPELKKVYTSNAGDNTIGVIDLKQMKVIKKLPTEAKPDGSAYAAPFHKLYVSDERGKAEAIVDVQQDTSTCKTKTFSRSSIRQRTRWSDATASGSVKAITGWHWTLNTGGLSWHAKETN
jgi:YVTN family beta-propeller protein